jgi:hypothetical protein
MIREGALALVQGMGAALVGSGFVSVVDALLGLQYEVGVVLGIVVMFGVLFGLSHLGFTE